MEDNDPIEFKLLSSNAMFSISLSMIEHSNLKFLIFLSLLQDTSIFILGLGV